MKQFTYTIKDALGIHARPAGQLVKVASAYQSSIKLASPAKEVDAKRIMSVMSLGVKQGEPVTVTCDGADEADAAKALEAFLQENL